MLVKKQRTWSIGTSLAHTVGFEPENQQKHAVRRQLILFAIFFFKMENMPVPYFLAVTAEALAAHKNTFGSQKSQQQQAKTSWVTGIDQQKQTNHADAYATCFFFWFTSGWVKLYLTLWQRKGWGYRGSTVETDLHSCSLLCEPNVPDMNHEKRSAEHA